MSAYHPALTRVIINSRDIKLQHCYTFFASYIDILFFPFFYFFSLLAQSHALFSLLNISFLACYCITPHPTVLSVTNTSLLTNYLPSYCPLIACFSHYYSLFQLTLHLSYCFPINLFPSSLFSISTHTSSLGNSLICLSLPYFPFYLTRGSNTCLFPDLMCMDAYI